MKSQIAIISIVCVLLGIGCLTARSQDDKPAKKIESKVLSDAGLPIIMELRNTIRQTTPTSSQPTEEDREYFSKVKKACPEVFEVSKQEEADFKAGKFSDEANKKKMKQCIQQLDQLKCTRSRLSVLLINRYYGNKMKGAELEIAARLLMNEVKIVKNIPEGVREREKTVAIN